MAIINDFDYHKPKDINETLLLLSELKGKAKILAGGTDLIVHLKEELVKPEIVIDIKGISELNKNNINNHPSNISANFGFI